MTHIISTNDTKILELKVTTISLEGGNKRERKKGGKIHETFSKVKSRIDNFHGKYQIATYRKTTEVWNELKNKYNMKAKIRGNSTRI